MVSFNFLCNGAHMTWFGSVDSTTISWNTVIYIFFLTSARAIYGGYGSP